MVFLPFTVKFKFSFLTKYDKLTITQLFVKCQEAVFLQDCQIQERLWRSCCGAHVVLCHLSYVRPCNPLEAIRWRGSPAMDTSKLLTAYQGGSNSTSDIK